jgi:hypothetical protein
MNDNLKHNRRTGLTSRRRFVQSAIIGSAGALSAELVTSAAFGDVDKATQVLLPHATQDFTPFKVQVPQAALDDLKGRLGNTRWPNKESVADWSQGVPLQKAEALIAYWRDKYDWRRFEARINAFLQYRTQIDGVGIHFIHARSPHQNALPIILTHGWPGSVVEFMEVIGPLSDPTRYGGRAEDAFHVVVPSLPGFAFSDKPVETGWDVNRIARAWATLMPRLGYERWVAQGGDWGAGVTHALAHQRPQGQNLHIAVLSPEDLAGHEGSLLSGLPCDGKWGSGTGRYGSAECQIRLRTRAPYRALTYDKERSR